MQTPALLLVDDDPIFLRSIVRAIRNDFAVVTAATLDEARQLLESQPFEVVVSDYDLGDAVGTDVLTIATRVQPRAHLVLTSGDLPGKRAWEHLDVVAVDKMSLTTYLGSMVAAKNDGALSCPTRRYPRVPVATGAILALKSQARVSARVRTVSCAGVGLVLDKPMALADRAQIQIEVRAGGQHFSLSGFVAWTNKTSLGVELDLIGTPASVRHPWVHWVSSLTDDMPAPLPPRKPRPPTAS